MRRVNTLFLSTTFLLATATCQRSLAQVSVFDEDRRGSVYLSIGSISPSYSPSTISITQNTSGNNFDLQKVSADNKSTKSGGILDNSIRIGYFFDFHQKWAIELNYDPIKYHITDGQSVHMKGNVDGAQVDKTIKFSAKDGYYYYLNGSNLVLINAVRRFRLYRNKQHTLSVDVLAKAGIGPVMPHVLNSLDNKVTDNPQFTVSGWNAAAEAALRFTIYRHVILEVGPKYDYASYANLNVYDGTAKQKLTTFGFVTSIGYTFSTTKRNPEFTKPEKKKRVITIRAIFPEDDGGGAGAVGGM